MIKEYKNRSDTNLLRKLAEEKLTRQSAVHTVPMAEGDALKLLHELEVHQIELEIQNEELKIALEKAEAATEKFTLLYDFAPSGYFTLDKDGFIINLNLNGAKMLGKERYFLIKSNFKQFISKDSKDIFLEFYREVLESNLKQTCEVSLKNQDNPSTFIYLEGVVSESKENYLIGAIDITKRRQAEEALLESETHLKDLNATKNKLFSIIAHDLRGPFTSIIGFSDLLIDQMHLKNYEKIEKYAKFIHESSMRAMNLLTNLLDWARLQTGNIKFNPKDIEISKLVNEVTELFKDPVEQKSITISLKLQENITMVSADEEMIGIVLRNLISNAIKFTKPKGTITISVRKNHEELMVIVSDNGVGIEKDTIKKIFQFGENQSTKGTLNEEGTGLGLLLCKDFILQHGGKIWVESDLGYGSSFYFTIPLNMGGLNH